MSFFSGTIYAKSLNMDTSFGLILPHDSRKHRGVEQIHEGIVPRDIPKTLILLHGLSDNWIAWAHRTSILRYAEDFDIAVLIPEVQRSFYHDMKNGANYYTYITEELPELAASMFKISVCPDDLMIAGLSMGGYGAFRCAFDYPDRFSGIGAFSSACDIKSFVLDEIFANRKELAGWNNDRRGIFGESIELPEESDLYWLSEQSASKDKKPRIFMTCGTEDFLYQSNIQFKKHLEKLNFDLRYEEWPGIHEWSFWDKSIQLMLEDFLVR